MIEADRLEEYFRTAFATLLSRAGKRFDHSELLATARKVATEMLAQSNARRAPRWNTAPLVPISSLRTPTMLHASVRVAAQVKEARTPQLVDVPVGNATQPAVVTSLTIIDSAGDQISTLDIMGDTMVGRAQTLFRREGMIEILGYVVAVPAFPNVARSDFYLHVEDLRETSSICDLIGATDVERVAAKARLRELHNDGRSPLDYIEQTVTQQLQVVGLGDEPLMRTALVRFPCVQAFSGGEVGLNAGKIHELLIGPPGSGKKIAGTIARVLNPREREASAAKISSAGLVGASYLAADGWRSQPGLIAQADEGVLVLQDAHAITQAQVAQLGPILQELIEDGVIRDSKAGGLRREASVALSIDLNRTSQLDVQGQATPREAALARLRPLLSRVDLIAEIPADPERAWRIGALLGSAQSVGLGRLGEQSWVRELRVLVATLRDRHEVVDLAAVQPLLGSIYEQIARSNQDVIRLDPSTGDLPLRLKLSLYRMTAAAARGNDRSVAEQQDVAEAAEFARIKLASFRLVAPDGNAVEASARDLRRAHYARYAGTIVRAEDVANSYRASTGRDVSSKTVRRDLKELGATEVSKGRWRLPPASTDGVAP